MRCCMIFCDWVTCIEGLRGRSLYEKVYVHKESDKHRFGRWVNA